MFALRSWSLALIGLAVTALAAEGCRLRHEVHNAPGKYGPGVLDIPAFMRVLVDQTLIDPNQYIATIEFGNEVSGGTGTTWIEHFEIQTE